MRLAVNLRLYVKGEIGGMENYIRHVIGGLARRTGAEPEKWVLFALESQADNVRDFAPQARVVSVTHENSEEEINSELRQRKYDFLFCPLLVLDPLRSPIRCAVTIPDLQHEFFPEFFDKNTLNWRRETFEPSVREADVVFTISEHSKTTIVEKFGVEPDKITVVGLDVDPEFRQEPTADSERAFAELGLPQKYIYFPANFWKHKNHVALLEALRILVGQGHPDLNLVLTGAPSTGMETVEAAAARLRVTEHVRFLGYLPRPVLAEIYRHARALVFVSLFEGFGIPILEAFHCGTPVVASRSTSCPEVAGDAAILVDERDPNAIAAGIERILNEPEMAARLTARGKLLAGRYTWTQAIEDTERKLDEAMSRGRSIEVHEHPTVSVVTPTYNMAHYLEETIRSVLSQDYPHIEYIVMDGGSQDGTVQLLQKYEGRLQFRSERDHGQADAVNKGFQLVSGPVFTFLNADDTYLPGAVGMAVKEMLANRKAGMVYGDAYYVREDGSVIAPYPTKPFSYELLSRNCFICQPASFMWREAFAAAGGMDQALHTALDYELWMRIAKKRPLHKIDAYLATSRMYRENKTLSRRKQVYTEIIDVVKKHYGFVPYDWAYGYASYLCDGKDQILETSAPTTRKQYLALALGLRHNPQQMGRYWGEWRVRSGVHGKYTGQWDDGWISQRYDTELPVPALSGWIVIAGRNLAPFAEGIELSVRVDGKLLGKVRVKETGPFHLKINCPELADRESVRLRIEADRTFSPVQNGDRRKLSCLIDSITLEQPGAQSA